MHFDDPAFWRAGAISTIAVMSIATSSPKVMVNW